MPANFDAAVKLDKNMPEYQIQIWDVFWHHQNGHQNLLGQTIQEHTYQSHF